VQHLHTWNLVPSASAHQVGPHMGGVLHPLALSLWGQQHGRQVVVDFHDYNGCLCVAPRAQEVLQGAFTRSHIRQLPSFLLYFHLNIQL
jgi:hypothetical protein